MIIQVTGYVWPFVVVPPLLAAVASGLVFTITPDSKGATLFGYQVLLGLGIGAATQTGVSGFGKMPGPYSCEILRSLRHKRSTMTYLRRFLKPHQSRRLHH